jgi:hypothetical protein
MTDVPRWILVIALLLAVVGLIAYARGQDHHRGPQEVGAFGHNASAAWNAAAG